MRPCFALRGARAVRGLVAGACLLAGACANTLGGAGTSAIRPPGTTGGELVGQRVEGMERVCAYRVSPQASEVQSVRVGLSEPCPANRPISQTHATAPDSARLESARVERRGRECIYVQGTGRWTITIPLDHACPLSAGLARAVVEAAGG